MNISVPHRRAWLCQPRLRPLRTCPAFDVWTDGWPNRAEVGYATYAALVRRVGEYLLDQVCLPHDPAARLCIQTFDEAQRWQPDNDMT